MATTTPSQARNRMLRAVADLLDPWPSKESRESIWAHFGSSCAYCGVALGRAERKAHLDHADPGAGNHLGNLVLACSRCNGDEKLGTPWREFLTAKVPDEKLRAERAARIEAWIATHPPTKRAASHEVATLRAELERMADDFVTKCGDLRTALRGEQEATPASADVPVQLWTDGACAGNPGPGGWAALLITNTKEEMLSGGEVHTTNNRMELVAAIRGLRALTRPSVVDLHIDSDYVYRGFAEEHLLVEGWRGRAVDGVWRLASKKPVVNQDLWEVLAEEVARHAVRWFLEDSHSDTELNDRVDAEACVRRDIFSRKARLSDAKQRT